MKLKIVSVNQVMFSLIATKHTTQQCKKSYSFFACLQSIQYERPSNANFFYRRGCQLPWIFDSNSELPMCEKDATLAYWGTFEQGKDDPNFQT